MGEGNWAELGLALFDESGDALFLVDPDTGLFIDVNPTAQRLTGFSRAMLAGKQASFIFRSEEKGGRHRLEHASRRTGIFHSQEGYYLRTVRDGVWVPVNLTIARLHVQPKTLSLITARDIREQREAHLQLKKLEAELSRMMRSISDCLWSAELNAAGQWTYRYFSPVVEKITGRTSTYFVEGLHRWHAIVHPDDRPRWQNMQQQLRQGLSCQEEYRVTWSDGTVRWLRESVHVDRPADSTTLHFDGVITDVTERMEAAERLAHSEERYRRFFEDDLAGAYIATPDKLLACNPAFARMFGLASHRDAVDADLASFFLKPQDHDDFLTQLRARRRLDYRETQLRRRDGQTIHVIENAIGAFDAHGQLLEITGYLVDNTERMKLEEQYRQAQKMEAIGRLAGGIAHDFNNLLTIILGYCEILAKNLTAWPPARNPIEQIKKAGERAASLTSQLLAFSRRQVIVPRILNLNTIVTDMDSMLRRLIGEDIVIHTRLAADLQPVKVDSNQIGQVLLNLVVNARDAMLKGGSLVIETANVSLDAAFLQRWPEVRPGPYVLLAVSDTGHGMDADTLSHIFEPFFTTKEVGKGTGLGLSMVYGTIKQSEGHIEVHSQPAHGTTFNIFLPVCIRDAAGNLPAPPPPPPRRGSETVLVVEDDSLVRNLVSSVLQKQGYSVLEADDGADAFQRSSLHAGPLHLLITDVVMPGMNGRDLARKLRATNPALRVMYISGHSDSVIFKTTGSALDATYLRKPFTPDDLARTVRDVLDKKLV